MSDSESESESESSNKSKSRSVLSAMSAPTPTHIGETEAWRAIEENGALRRVAPQDIPESVGRNAVKTLDHLTSAAQLKEIERLLETETATKVDPKCVRNAANWSTVEPYHKFDKPRFDPFYTAADIKTRSPKLDKLLQNIQRLDSEDQAKYGHKFKHFVFSDIKTAQGAKAVAAGLLANGYALGYNVRKVGKKVGVTAKSPEELKEMGPNNFFLLSSVGLYGEPLRVAVKKDVLQKFNSRPTNDGYAGGNVHGELARIIVMDSGFKEGIDLFDIKYVHIFEPQTTPSDQKQVIGRGTRTCGQKGLRFNPLQGWPLYVFKYDLAIAPEYRADFRGSETAFGYYLLSNNIDIRLLNLASNLERVAIEGSVDYKLNKNIHQFTATNGELSKGGDPDFVEGGAPMKAEARLSLRLSKDSPPGEKHEYVAHYVDKYFGEYKWDEVQMENLCGYEGPESQKGGAPNLIKLSPTQDFISTYFSAELPIKGMVLWQSVGTGKTCTAIATATRQFEPLGYTILWVTRTTLKNDIWKNMFDMVCHEGIRDKVEAGVTIPANMPDRMRLLSKSWAVRPISYKQFSNLVSKNNRYYDQLVKRNGEQDPLRKTLIIIDEAHKLYGGGDLSSIERPDMPAFHQALMNSYAVSGKDSVRVLFMTATPITSDPLELVKLVNLCRPLEKQIPADFDTFASSYLDDLGDFTEVGRLSFLDDIAGHISYLNREGDVRQFARPILREVLVPLVDNKMAKDIADFDVVGAREIDNKVADLRTRIDAAKSRYEGQMTGFKKSNSAKLAKICDEYPVGVQPTCEKLAKKYTAKMLKSAKEKTQELKTELTELSKEWKTTKQDKSAQIKSARIARREFPDEYEKYQKSGYYKLKTCDQQFKETRNLDEFLETQPAFYRAKELEDTIKSELATIEDRLKSEVVIANSKIRSYQNLLKTELRPIESQVVRRTIQEAKERVSKTKKRNARWMKRVTLRAGWSLKQLDKYQKDAKKMIRRSINQKSKDERRFAREEQKVKRMEEDADEDLTDEFKAAVAEAQQNIREELRAKVMKEAQKTEKARISAEKRQQKSDNATRKAQEKAIKAQEKADKAKQKAANTTRKTKK